MEKYQKTRKRTAAVLTALASGIGVVVSSSVSANAETNVSTGLSMSKVEEVISYITSSGRVVGTGKITAVDKIVDGKKQTVYSVDDSIPAGYVLADETDIQEMPDHLTVKSLAGNESDSTADASTEYMSKTVTYVDKSGKILGTGKLTISMNVGNGGTITTHFVDKTIPAGYKLENNNALLSYPDKLTVVEDPNSKEKSDASYATTNSNGPTQPPFFTINEKNVLFVDESGKTVGTGKIKSKVEKYYRGHSEARTKTTNSISELPEGYQLQNPEDILQFPSKLTVVPISASSVTEKESANTGKQGSNISNTSGAENNTSGTNNTSSENTSVNMGAKNNNSGTKNMKTDTLTGNNASANNMESTKNNTSAENLTKNNNKAKKHNKKSDKSNNTLLSESSSRKNDDGIQVAANSHDKVKNSSKTPATTTITTVSSPSEASDNNGSNTSSVSTLPQTGNTHFEKSTMLGALLVTAAVAAAGLRKKQ